MQHEKNSRLHPNLCLAVHQALNAIFLDNHHADKVVQELLQSNKKWGARDRHFIAESIYEIVRWKRQLLFLVNLELIENQEDTRILFAIWVVRTYGNLPAWEMFEQIDLGDFQRQDLQTAPRKIRESIPDWLDELGASQIPNWDAEIQALNQTAQVILRVNTQKTSREELQKLLAEQAIETESIAHIPSALRLKIRRNIRTSAHFKDGLFEIQDAASQLVAPFLDVQQNHVVMDACAGAGGKTLHLANLLGNQGKLVAMDIEKPKLIELQKRATRADARLKTLWIRNLETLKPYQNTADRLLLDVPCSGLGVLRRNPDAKWKLTPKFLQNVVQKQQRILTNYAPLLKVGGKMVYATCSILPAENQEQIQYFLEKHPHQYELLSEQTVSPAQSQFDGFYMACLLKKS